MPVNGSVNVTTHAVIDEHKTLDGETPTKKPRVGDKDDLVFGLNIPAAEGLPTYYVEGMSFPKTAPPEITKTKEPLVFNSKAHLALATPEWIRPLITEPSAPDEFKFPIPQNDKNFPGLAFTAPFQVLSSEGVAAFRETVALSEYFARETPRQPKSLRGLGYLSDFARTLAYDKNLLRHLSDMAGEELVPDDHSMNIPQVTCDLQKPLLLFFFSWLLLI